MKTAQQHRDLAAKAEQDRQESWERSDTDGFLTQWACGLTAQKERIAAEIAENGGKDTFTGLWTADGKRRLKARLIDTKFGTTWLIHEDDRELTDGRTFVPVGVRSRVQKRLGLKEFKEWAPAAACINGRGTGLSGTAWATSFRTGSKWGQDATRIE